jgi:hypothetical protein
MQLTDAGKLSLGVICDADSVCGTDIRSTRPLAAQVLKGRTAEQVRQIVPLLFNVCGHAQGAAANAALHAARQAAWPAVAVTERWIACEAMQEHLWRLMLDWPKLLGLAQQEQRFASWHALLRKIGAGEVDMGIFLREFERDGLGMTAAEWQQLDGYQALQTWWRGADSMVARSLATLAGLEHGRQDACESRLLPAWSAADAQQACAGRWGANFSARPEWQGVAPETGAWSYFADRPLLRDAWQQSGSKALVRLLARIWDVVEMASGSAAPRLDAASPAAGEGIAVVRTARGLLMHHARVSGEKVADYAIVAPTEWNFHPDGAFAQGMSGLKERDTERLRRLAHIEALSLDPCVAYEIEVHHA